jgi:hypothetical protein
MTRILKTLHGWLGILMLPWFVIIGLTGLYLNHSALVLSYLPSGTYDEKQFDAWANPVPVNLETARAIAASVWPAETFARGSQTIYHNRRVDVFEGESGRVIVAISTGHYWVKTQFFRKTYDPNGRLLDVKFYWGHAFLLLHSTGWVNSDLGTWLADMVAGAMIFFGLSGILIYWLPRKKQRKNRRVKTVIEVKRGATPRPKRIKLEN